MPITPKAIQDLLDELEASKQSRLRAWNVLQRLRSVLSEAGNVTIPHRPRRPSMPRAKALEHALNPCTSGNRRSKACVNRYADFGTQLSRKNANAIIPHVLQAL